MSYFSNKILTWYQNNKRDFPWRNTKNPYKIWLSEVILQQTKTEQGLPYYLKFIKEYPTVFHLAKASEQDVLKLWQGLGYYSRARNLHATAKEIVAVYNGVFPNTYTQLIKLKGVGDYTASAIASICFNQKEAVLDGNVFRVLSRYFGIETPINTSKAKLEFKKLALKLLPNTNIANYNQAIMDFGSRQCSPKKTDCFSCILNTSCYAYANKRVDILPIKIKKNNIRKRYFAYLVIIDSKKRTIVHKRTGKDIWHNLFEFTLFESDKEATQLEIIKHLKQHKIQPAEIFKYNDTPIKHKLSHQTIYTVFWIVTLNEEHPKAISFTQIKKLPVSILTHNFLERFII